MDELTKACAQALRTCLAKDFSAILVRLVNGVLTDNDDGGQTVGKEALVTLDARLSNAPAGGSKNEAAQTSLKAVSQVLNQMCAQPDQLLTASRRSLELMVDIVDKAKVYVEGKAFDEMHGQAQSRCSQYDCCQTFMTLQTVVGDLESGRVLLGKGDETEQKEQQEKVHGLEARKDEQALQFARQASECKVKTADLKKKDSCLKAGRFSPSSWRMTHRSLANSPFFRFALQKRSCKMSLSSCAEATSMAMETDGTKPALLQTGRSMLRITKNMAMKCRCCSHFWTNARRCSTWIQSVLGLVGMESEFP